jgi:extracellular factor (EF) 3-hydroxypalmitic acid methyl ester biosynthesis protein
MEIELKKEKRHKPRKEAKTQGQEKALVEISLPFPKGIKISKEVVDIGEQGLSFRMSSNEGYFLPGTPLKHVAILDGGKKYITAAEVIYANKVEEDGNSYYRIGLQFVSQLKRKSLVHQNVLPYSLRPHRYAADEIIKNISKLISFTDSDGNSVNGTILNFSKYGAAFELEDTELILRISDIIENFKIIISDEVVYSGRVTVVNLQDKGNKILVGVSLFQAWLDVDKIFHLKRKADIEREMSTFVTSLSSTDKIAPMFKVEVSDLRYFLEGLKRRLDNEEANIRKESLEQQKIMEKYILETIEKLARTDISRSLETINKIVKDLPQEAHPIYKKYFQNQLQSLWLLAPFVDRIFRKPLGYAGDYEMANIIFRAGYEGDTLFGKLLNHYCCDLPPARAHRERVPYLLKKIDEHLEDSLKNNHGAARFMSIGCGPAKEIQQLITSRKNTDSSEVTLIDFDTEALYYCQERIRELKTLTNSAIKVGFINKTVSQIVKEPYSSSGGPGYDLIYCMGLADYLVTPVCQKLTVALHRWLKRGGRLIVSNIDAANEYRYPMEFGCEWYLFHRSKEQLREFVHGVSGSNNVIVESDPTGLNNFLVIQK